MKKLNAIKGATYRRSKPSNNWEWKKHKHKPVARKKATVIQTKPNPVESKPTVIQSTATLESMGLSWTPFTERKTNITGV